ncbi:AAA domain-containing protein, partial [Campylobacter jejuni]|nr:AAA domain-containing protein [Campylobacter jejuni]
ADEIYNSAYVKAILNYLKSQGLEDYKEKDEKTNSPYIIIIDEINRGNVSKIFGELITLIEPSKRIGEPEELRVTLPYSRNDFYDKKGFGVPSNVYIIGTMNTADRSITSLDTALRRRFEFVEMMPNPNVLSDNCEDVNLKELLKAINTRIEYLLDREKTIGHAFFIDIDNLEKLKDVFQNKIIPLL